MTTLISFLGKGQNGYREANYQFDDGDLYEKQKYFGLALAQKINPNKIILLGTSGSMWDVFLESGGDGLESEWLALSDSVQNQTVCSEQLQPFNAYLSQKLNADVQCVLIPSAKTTEEQIEILSVLADNLADNDTVVFDVTHSFRHLPMLSLVVSRFLKRTKNIHVEHIYYGMLQDGISPVLKLDGMLQLLDWIDALSTFDKDGDYGVFADLLVQENLDKTSSDLLNQASFYERTTNSVQAKESLNTIFKDLDNFSSPVFDLFKPQLTKRLQWLGRAHRGLSEQALADEYLRRKDYLRAVIFAMEGMISAQIYRNKGNTNDYKEREKVKDNLRERNADFKFLSNLRNALAHGLGNQDDEIKSILENAERTDVELRKCFNNLFRRK